MQKDELHEILDSSSNIVFFGGAGVSTESNIPDFRSANGLYQKNAKREYAPEEILSATFFLQHTKEFFDFYRCNMIYPCAKPNNAHLALAKLEAKGKLQAVITQNIDGLHQIAGSENVLELHGSVHRNRCIKCHKFFDLSYIINTEGVPHCDECNGVVKPEVVLYEEQLDDQLLSAARNYIAKADVLLVGGTSLSVYPAAGLVTAYSGKKLILINKTPTLYDHKANLVLNGNIAELL